MSVRDRAPGRWRPGRATAPATRLAVRIPGRECPVYIDSDKVTPLTA
ncbi:hypothetical protein WKI65_38190 [Streptomyces sp. MS1.AVA.3]